MVKKSDVTTKLLVFHESPKLRKLMYGIFFLLGILFTISLVRNIYTLRASNERILEAQNKLNLLKAENEELASEVNMVESDFYKEKLGRDKLGLAKEGEIIAVLPPEEELREIAPKLENSQEEVLPKPNWRRWLDLFVN